MQILKQLRITNATRKRLEQERFEKLRGVEFLEAVDRNLVEIEARIMESHSDVREHHAQDKEFFGDMSGRMEDMSQTLSAPKPLPDLRDVLLGKMKTITSVIEHQTNRSQKRLESADERMDALKNDLKTLITRVNDAESKARTLEKQAMVDPLTEIPNRRAYEGHLTQEWERFKRYGDSFSMLMIDLDHFKNINDQYGHAVGDMCLKAVVNLMKPKLRASDFLARYGGEEFVVILPDAGKDGSCKVAEKLRKKVEGAKFVYGDEKVSVTISIGGTMVGRGDQSPEDVFVRLDAAMYDAKEEGRNKVVWRNA